MESPFLTYDKYEPKVSDALFSILRRGVNIKDILNIDYFINNGRVSLINQALIKLTVVSKLPLETPYEDVMDAVLSIDNSDTQVMLSISVIALYENKELLCEVIDNVLDKGLVKNAILLIVHYANVVIGNNVAPEDIMEKMMPIINVFSDCDIPIEWMINANTNPVINSHWYRAIIESRNESIFDINIDEIDYEPVKKHIEESRLNTSYM